MLNVIFNEYHQSDGKSISDKKIKKHKRKSMEDNFDYFKAMILAKILLERIHGFRLKFILLSIICGLVCSALGFFALTSDDSAYINALILAFMISFMVLVVYRAYWLDIQDEYYEMIKSDYDYYMDEYKEFLK